MTHAYDYNIAEEIVGKLGLRLSDKRIIPKNAPGTRIFEYPCLDNVFVMETDLYGNVIPKDFCFLAFYGSRGLIGKYLRVEKLKNASLKDIENLVQSHSNG